MKPRTLIVTIELETDSPVSEIRESYREADKLGTVRSVHVQVAQPVKVKR